jgi:hypothetical protein
MVEFNASILGHVWVYHVCVWCVYTSIVQIFPLSESGTSRGVMGGRMHISRRGAACQHVHTRPELEWHGPPLLKKQ